MDGEQNGKPYLNGWFGGKTPYSRKHPYLQDDPRYFWRTLLMWKKIAKNEADWMPSEDDAAQAPVGGVAWMVQRINLRIATGINPSPNKWRNTCCNYIVGGDSNIFGLFTPKIGQMIQFDVRIFFRWVELKPPTRGVMRQGCRFVPQTHLWKLSATDGT